MVRIPFKKERLNLLLGERSRTVRVEAAPQLRAQKGEGTGGLERAFMRSGFFLLALSGTLAGGIGLLWALGSALRHHR